MATFTGTGLPEIITPNFVSPTVIAEGSDAPGDDSDTIQGGLGDDTLGSGGGNDFVRGDDGNDTARLGSGDDLFAWFPGDDNDIVDGQGGIDTLDFSGANVAEDISITANGSRIAFFRNVAAVTMDLVGIELLVYHAFGGADFVTVSPLAGTDAQRVLVNLESSLGSGTGDAQADTVRVEGTESGDSLTVSETGTMAQVSGMSYRVKVSNLETSDAIQIAGNGGSDLIDAAGAIEGTHQILLDGGEGNDTIIGSARADSIVGGEGRDRVRGGAGDDVALLGNAADFYAWKNGDGNDVIEGQGGEDELELVGGPADDSFVFAANGARLSIFGSVGGAFIDVNEIERISIRAGRGIDSLNIGDLTGTAVERIDIELAEKRNSPSSDLVAVAGTAAGDFISLSLADDHVSVEGLPATFGVHHADARDRLVLNGGLGGDLLDASALPAAPMRVEFRGGDGNDVLIGSGGNDRFSWSPGDDNDTINGRGGSDLLDVSGSAVSEVVNILSNGSQLNLLRDVAAVKITTNEIERFELHAGGGIDTITVGNLARTGGRSVSLDLAGVAGTGVGDAQADSVLVLGRDIDDNISVSGSSSAIAIKGLPWQVRIIAREGDDRVVISAGAGDDVVELAGLEAGAGIRIDGGLGKDTLLAGSGNDELLFDTAIDGVENVDTIRHFSVANDIIVLDDSVFATVGALGTLAPSAFHVGKTSTDAAHRVIYDDSNGKLFFDNDGLGGADAVLFAKLEPGLSLGSENFLIV